MRKDNTFNESQMFTFFLKAAKGCRPRQLYLISMATFISILGVIVEIKIDIGSNDPKRSV